MYPTFEAQVDNGRLMIGELRSRGEQMLAGKQITVVVPDDTAGEVRTGRYEDGVLCGADGVSVLGEFEGKQVMVIVRDELVAAGNVDAFDHKFQLGAKIGDLDT